MPVQILWLNHDYSLLILSTMLSPLNQEISHLTWNSWVINSCFLLHTSGHGLSYWPVFIYLRMSIKISQEMGEINAVKQSPMLKHNQKPSPYYSETLLAHSLVCMRDIQCTYVLGNWVHWVGMINEGTCTGHIPNVITRGKSDPNMTMMMNDLIAGGLLAQNFRGYIYRDI